jgi:YbgC/YbaW family acyl-CoA thioester hydrolase
LWECDSLGHLNSPFYSRIFDDASTGAMLHFGFSMVDAIAAGFSWADVKLELEYLAEVKVNSVLSVTARLVSLGRASIVVEYTMHNDTAGVVAATARIKSVCFDLQERKSMPWPEALRTRLEQQLTRC